MLTALSTTPRMAAPHTTEKIVQPTGPRSVTRVMGVYVPAIRRKIDVWSSTRSTALARGFVIAWYRVEAVNSKISVTPNVMPPASL